MAVIAAVFTIGHVARILGEDEDWLHDLSIDMFPEDGCLHVYGVGEDGVTAFTQYGIECLKQIIADERTRRDSACATQKPGSRSRRNAAPPATPTIPVPATPLQSRASDRQATTGAADAPPNLCP
jgi:hypothetical protein